MKKITSLLFGLLVFPGFVSASSLEITTPKLPPATIGQPYSTQIKVKGGVAPYIWTPLSTTYPAGCCILGLNGNADPINSHFITFNTQSSQTIVDNFPAGVYYWTFKVEDAVGNVTIQTLSLTIKPAR